MQTLTQIEAISREIRGLKGIRSVKWEQLRNQLRQACEDVEELARAAKAWV